VGTDEGKRVSWVDGQRCQHWVKLLTKEASQVFMLLPVQLMRPPYAYAKLVHQCRKKRIVEIQEGLLQEWIKLCLNCFLFRIGKCGGLNHKVVIQN
jgi:hypothetical protein